MRQGVFLFVLVVLALPGYAGAQDTMHGTNTDSLWAVWRSTTAPDTSRLNALQTITDEAAGNAQPDSMRVLGGMLVDLAMHGNPKKYLANALLTRGNAYMRLSRSGEAIADLQRSAALFEKEGLTLRAARVLNNLGSIYVDMSDHANAITVLTRSLKLAETAGDSSLTARTLGNIGIIYYHLGDHDHAMDYYQRRLAMVERMNETGMLVEVLNNMALVYNERGDRVKAMELYDRSMDISRRTHYWQVLGKTLMNAGWVHWDAGDKAKAIANMEQATALADSISDPELLSGTLNALAWVRDMSGSHNEAIGITRRALSIAQDHGLLGPAADAANMLYDMFKTKGNMKESLAMHELYITLRDSINSDRNKQEVMHQRFQYDYEKKEALMNAEQEKKDAVAAEELRRKNVQRNAFIGGFALMILLAGVFFTQRNRISKEKARSEELLLNILPEEVAEELKAKGEAEAKLIDQVTVLFTDFKGFTAMSEQLTAKELVADIHECFSAFDRITARHGIEKIKTIGDAYMAAGGLPTPNTTHALDVVKAALEIRDFIAEGKGHKIAAGLPYFEIRIGIHTGPVVAGIVGVKKFAYDIWGDTVNTASRMESSGEVGQVNISEATYALVKDEPVLSFTSRGKVQAKGKGEMEMYFVRKVGPAV